jgi:quercetin dioxygenase-like cupin family protein
LVTQFDFSSDWPNWERHPAGDELVILLAGSAELCLELSSGTSRMRLSAPGEFVLVPRDTWHTARTTVACSMLFVTHGPGTEHREAD